MCLDGVVARDQKEGNGNINIVCLRISDRLWFNIRNGSSGKRPWWEYHKKLTLTPRIAGSFGTAGGFSSLADAGPSSILKSLTSVPRKTMYS